MQWKQLGAPLAVLAYAYWGAAVAQDAVLNLDWPAVQARYAEHPTRIAHAIDHQIAASSHGRWSSGPNLDYWEYELSVPGARFVAAHLDRLHLPPQARLWIGDLEYTTRDIKASGVWSRLSPGEVLVLRAQMPPTARPAFALSMRSVQAGFRARPAEPRSQQAPDGCTRWNYSCAAAAENRPASRAVIGYTVFNTGWCTGTLINNTRQDFRPLILTAAHCGEDLAAVLAAETVVVYWDAVAPCEEALPDAYVWAGATQAGGIHRSRVDESWLFELDAPPVSEAFPYWLGFDASDAQPTQATAQIHHSGASVKQFTAHDGPPTKDFLWGITPGSLAVLEVPAWSVYSRAGRSPSGASGSSLLDSTWRTIGTHYGSDVACQVGGGREERYSFQRLAHGWDGNDQPGPPLRDFLDPDQTGQRVLDGAWNPARPRPDADMLTKIAADASARAASSTVTGGALGAWGLILLGLLRLRSRHLVSP